MAYDLIGNRVPCQILGRDIGRGLATLVDKMESQTINELDSDLREYRAREMEKFMARDQESKAQAINDKVSSLLVLVENMGERNRTVSQLKADIQKMFTDKSGALTLATVHKSKGLEFNRVFILDRWTRMPCKWAKQPWQQVQEDNLIYVAYTRSRDRLNFISME
jgi:superfamily I DNA/RNA helicase